MIPVTPETVKATYTYLLYFPPFNRWGLPHPNDLLFYVVPFVSEWGEYNPERKTIRVSHARVSTHQSLLLAVAHEMCHVRQDVMGKWPTRNVHNADFKRLAKQVCKHFYFDPANF